MSNTTTGLRHQITGAKDLQSVVRTMKAVAASNIGQYERSVAALADYYRTVELGLGACFRANTLVPVTLENKASKTVEIGMIVFGSDQGLVGQFNDVVADQAVDTLAKLPLKHSGKHKIWAVGERVCSHLADRGLVIAGTFELPSSIKGITRLVERILLESKDYLAPGDHFKLYLTYNRSESHVGYAPFSQQLLPLDEGWRRKQTDTRWPTARLPEIVGGDATLKALISSYLFISIYRACAESLAAENASRLAAMQRAEKNIDELLESQTEKFNRLRQSGIDEELFDVVSGFEAIGAKDGGGAAT